MPLFIEFSKFNSKYFSKILHRVRQSLIPHHRPHKEQPQSSPMEWDRVISCPPCSDPSPSSFPNTSLNTLRPQQDGCHFADGILKCVLLTENSCILILISLNCVPKGPVNHKAHTGLDNGFAANRWHAFIWTNDDLVYWYIYASLGLNELILIVPEIFRDLIGYFQ